MASREETPYRDPDRPVPERVEDLLGRMTVEEKVGQIVGAVTNDLSDIREKIDDYHTGVASPFAHGGEENNTPRKAARLSNDLQRYAVEETRLGIPFLFYVDADHGHARISGATAFPHNLGMAATRNPELVEAAANVTATEIRATGAHQNLNPVTDVAREVRWGRTYETFGESPHLCAELCAAEVRGYQGSALGSDSVVATPKHFPAYSEPARGEDASYVDISEYTLRQTFLPPFEATIDAGAESIMPCYNALEGEPVHGSWRYLTELLRHELGFEGYAVSDWGGVHMLHDDHRTAGSFEEAVWQATNAGLDVASVGGPDYADAVLNLVRDGEISEERIDASARRVLSAKVRLGLFEDPYVEVDRADEILGCEEHREIARQAARESITLLKNDDVLPLGDVDEILVTGPNADSVPHQFGGWSSVSDPEPPAVTVREGIETAAGDTTVTYEPGATLEERDGLDRAVERAADADVAVAVLGEGKYVHEFGERFGEFNADHFPNRHQLELPDAQRELVEGLVETGTPTIVVLISGRPLAIPEIADLADGLLFAYYPGTEGGSALADLLFGTHNPSGKLPVSMPRSAGHLPTRFNYYPHPTPVGHESEGGTHLDSYDPLYPFGHGLSYTEFSYDDLDLSTTAVGPKGTVRADITISNVGDLAGTEAFDCFVTDRYSSTVTPVRRHVGFDRVSLAPGETGTTSVTIDVDALTNPRANPGARTESGEFDVFVGDQEATFAVESRF